MPEDAAFCPHCGRRMWVPETSSAEKSSRPKDNIVGALAYVAVIPAIVFLLVEPFKRNRFVRFHSFQSIFLAAATITMALAMRLIFSVLSLIPWFGYLMAWLAVTLVVLGWLTLWMVLLVKALQGELFRLPVIGAIAERA